MFFVQNTLMGYLQRGSKILTFELRTIDGMSVELHPLPAWLILAILLESTTLNILTFLGTIPWQAPPRPTYPENRKNKIKTHDTAFFNIAEFWRFEFLWSRPATLSTAEGPFFENAQKWRPDIPILKRLDGHKNNFLTGPWTKQNDPGWLGVL